jgi:hypothetical protein
VWATPSYPTAHVNKTGSTFVTIANSDWYTNTAGSTWWGFYTAESGSTPYISVTYSDVLTPTVATATCTALTGGGTTKVSSPSLANAAYPLCRVGFSATDETALSTAYLQVWDGNAYNDTGASLALSGTSSGARYFDVTPPEGSTAYRVRVTDSSGNSGYGGGAWIYKDTLPPSTSAPTASSNPVNSPQTVTITASPTASGLAANVMRVQFYKDGSAFGPPSTVAPHTAAVGIGKADNGSTQSWTYTATDDYDNTSAQSAALSLTVAIPTGYSMML